MDLAVIKVRERLVLARAMMINAVKGLMKSFGFHHPRVVPTCLASPVLKCSRERLLRIVQPLLEQIQALTLKIQVADRSVEEIAEKRGSQYGGLEVSEAKRRGHLRLAVSGESFCDSVVFSKHSREPRLRLSREGTVRWIPLGARGETRELE